MCYPLIRTIRLFPHKVLRDERFFEVSVECVVNIMLWTNLTENWRASLELIRALICWAKLKLQQSMLGEDGGAGGRVRSVQGRLKELGRNNGTGLRVLDVWAFLSHLDVENVINFHQVGNDGRDVLFRGKLDLPRKQKHMMTLLLDDSHVDMLQKGLIELCSENIDVYPLRTALVEADSECGEVDSELGNSLIGVNFVAETLLIVLPTGVEGVVITFDRHVQTSYSSPSKRKSDRKSGESSFKVEEEEEEEYEWDGGGDVIFAEDIEFEHIIAKLSQFSQRRCKRVFVIHRRMFFVRYVVKGSNVVISPRGLHKPNLLMAPAR